MKNILLLSTGGTIASVPSATGLIPALDGEALVRRVPALAGRCRITCKEILNLDSSNLEPKHWQLMAQEVAAAYEHYDGIVLTHGTDTMAYSAAALSTMLHNCAKPVVFTGSQLPMEAADSDAPANLWHAFEVACSDVPGVCLVFGDKVIRGDCAKKLYTEAFNGFASINAPVLAQLTAEGIEWNPDGIAQLEQQEGPFSVSTELEERVAVLKLIPGSKPDILEYYCQAGYRGLVLEGFGAGGVPNAENNWLPALEKVLQAGVVVVCATQCLYDGVALHKYPIGSLAERLGARSAGKQTTEAVVVSLMQELAQTKC